MRRQAAVPYLFLAPYLAVFARLLGVADRPVDPPLVAEHAGATPGSSSLLVNWGRLFHDAAFLGCAEEHVSHSRRTGADDAGAGRASGACA